VSLAETQAAFAAALLDPRRPAPEGVTGPAGGPNARRFAVYRNNVTVSLIEALRAAFPAVETIIGDELFRHVAREYARAHPPRSPVLLAYGDGFADFLAQFEPTRRRTYLAAVARLERLRLAAFHAADADPLDPAALAAMPPEALGAVSFGRHPAAAVLRADVPVVTVWSMNAGLRSPAPVDFSQKEDALVTRPRHEVEIRHLRPGGAIFLASLLAGAALGQAAEAAFAYVPGFDLAANLADALAAGAFTAPHAPGA